MDKYILKIDENGKEITVHDVQLVLLEMAKDIDEICRSNNIPYFLNGGSALGAIRHKGFIPWDDDYDISMMYDDYKRFIKALNKDLDKDKYVFQCFDTHRKYNVSIPGMKIRKKGTYLKEVNSLLKNRIDEGDGSNGVFVDVFVYDCCSTNKLIDLPFRVLNTLIMPWMIAIDNIGINPMFLKKWYVGNARTYGKLNRGSEYVGFDLCWTFKSPLKPFIFKKSDIYPVQYVEFEDTKLPVAANPHAFLCMGIAPSYMSIPSEDKRAPKHIVDIDLENGHGHK